jgi:orotidine-5'-phosphate decarboxylase
MVQDMSAANVETQFASANERIILPLDFESLAEVMPLIKALKDHVGLFKIGLTLFLKEGFDVIRRIHEIAGGQKIFFDMKFHDTPWQVAGASAALMSGSVGVRFVTVHTIEGETMPRAVVGAMRNGTKVLGITVLTSLSEKEAKQLGYATSVQDRVIALSTIAKNSGCAGVVCSGHEAKAVKKKTGSGFIVVTPGIRPSWANVDNDDQRRVMTPAEAVQNGADYVVVGRPIFKSKDPVGAAKKIAEEMEEAAVLKSI